MEDTTGEYEKYARENGFKLNPDSKIVAAIITGLLHHEKIYGQRYCPCRRVTGETEEDKKIICPCVYHLDEIKEQGYCHCRLFFRK